MTRTVKIALIQTNSQREREPNTAFVIEQARASRAAGAEFITTPEIVGMFEPTRARVMEKARIESEDPSLAAFRDLARELGCWFLVGSLAVRTEEAGDGRLANRSFLLDGHGNIVARYDKIHMFDVDIAGDRKYRESESYRPGRRAVLAETPWGRLGMTVCYDLRFPHLYRALAQGGAEFITIPAAFTQKTGEAHWHVLMRARAIETGCFVVAPAQCGEHAEGRRTFGHSIVVAPWGEVLADGGASPGTSIAEIDFDRVAEARRMVPSLSHDRPYEIDTRATAAAAPRRAIGD
ncbi:MAG: carbon-nitrogen hydrolase family protein [Alphaproteobacteria bacterium]|nr:carbon-nitrogen hydrolase family protein [Alphaproteobacteria bacterium]